MTAEPLWIVDGTALLLRAWFVGAPGTTADGQPNGAVRQSRSRLARLVRQHKITVGAVIFDQSLQTFRVRIDPSYKARRPAPPAELIQQFRWFEAAAAELGFGVFGDPEYEADDFAASLSRVAREQGRPVRIVAEDKDLFQLVVDEAPDVCCVSLRTGDWIRADDVVAKLGVRPDQVIDYQSLVGDSSDGVRGVPGIGAKTAAGLLAHVGSLDALLDDPGLAAGAAVRGARKLPQKIDEHRDVIALARRLVTLRTDLELGADPLGRCVLGPR